MGEDMAKRMATRLKGHEMTSTNEPYTPSTEEVARWWGKNPNVAQEWRQASFNRMLASVRAEAEAKGRAEGDSALRAEIETRDNGWREADKWRERAKKAEADRDALVAVIEKVREEAGGAYQDIPADNIDAILSTAPADVLAERDACVRKQALLDAAGEIRAEMGRDEVEMHQLSHEHELPQLSRVMLNGATRFAERLTARATQEDINA